MPYAPDIRFSFDDSVNRITPLTDKGAAWLKSFTSLQVTIVKDQTISTFTEKEMHAAHLAALAAHLTTSVQTNWART